MMIWSWMLMGAVASAGTRWLANDGFDDNSEVGFQGGFIAGECWGAIYTPDSSDYPFSVDSVIMLVGGSSSQQLFSVNFFNPTSMNMTGATPLGGEGVAISGNDSNWNQVTVSELEIGTIEIDSGLLGVSICHEKHDGYPSISRDTDGLSNPNANWIYADGLGWYTSQTFGLTGDWIMRVCIESDAISGDECDASSGGGGGDTNNGGGGDTNNGGGGGDTGEAGLFVLDSITPSEVVVGEAVDVVLLGSGFASGAEARIGGIPLVGQETVNAETISGRTPTTLPAGVHDVEVVLDDGSTDVLAGAFTVTDGKGGCSHARGTHWLWVMGLPLLLLRRRLMR